MSGKARVHLTSKAANKVQTACIHELTYNNMYETGAKTMRKTLAVSLSGRRVIFHIPLKGRMRRQKRREVHQDQWMLVMVEVMRVTGSILPEMAVGSAIFTSLCGNISV